MTILIFLWRIEKCLKGTNKNNIQEFILWGLIIHHSFNLGQQILPLKKIAIVFGNWWKVANYTGCQTKFIVQHLAHFWPFPKALADKLMPHSKISFKIWLNYLALALHYFLWKPMPCGLKKVGFQTAWASPKPWTKLNVWQQEHFWPFLKVPEEKLMPPSQISFKSW